MRMLQKLIASQLRLPAGLLAPLTGYQMNRTNHQMTVSTLERLMMRPRQSVLDIGFGGGNSLAIFLEANPLGQVVGVEASSAMLNLAKVRFFQSVQQGRLKLFCAKAENLPLQHDKFDLVFTVNTIYFWKDLWTVFMEIYRVLKSNGCVGLSFRDSEGMRSHAFAQHNFSLYSLEEVQQEMSDCGFVNIQSALEDDGFLPYYSLVAHRP
jgi:arsenite methyltransferase